MTAVSDAAIVRITLADYAVSDASKKVNMLGGGVGVVGLPHSKDAPEVLRDSTAPFAVVASMAVPPALHGSECDTELTLEDESGNVVSSVVGDSMQELRIPHHAELKAPMFDPDLGVPSNRMRARIQWVLTFPTGLVLPTRVRYLWRLTIDGVSRDDWTEELYVAERMVTSG